VNVINAPFTQPAAVEPLPEAPLWKQSWVLDLSKILGAIVLGLLLILAVLRPMMRNLAAAREPQAGGAMAGAAGEGGLAEDQLTLSGAEKEGVVKLPGPGAYEENIDMVKQVVQEDPKLVAQVMKNWIAND
jgi:flagellar M-ring protein FliF